MCADQLADQKYEINRKSIYLRLGYSNVFQLNWFKFNRISGLCSTVSAALVQRAYSEIIHCPVRWNRVLHKRFWPCLQALSTPTR